MHGGAARGDAGMRAALFQSARTQGSACFGRHFYELARASVGGPTAEGPLRDTPFLGCTQGAQEKVCALLNINAVWFSDQHDQALVVRCCPAADRYALISLEGLEHVEPMPPMSGKHYGNGSRHERSYRLHTYAEAMELSLAVGMTSTTFTRESKKAPVVRFKSALHPPHESCDVRRRVPTPPADRPRARDHPRAECTSHPRVVPPSSQDLILMISESTPPLHQTTRLETSGWLSCPP